MAIFLLTWTDGKEGYPKDYIARWAERFKRDGEVHADWRIRAYNQANAGDLVWALKQGPASENGIFAVGEIEFKYEEPDCHPLKTSRIFRIKFSKFTNPKNVLLIDEFKTKEILGRAMNNQFSGCILSTLKSDALANLLS